MHFFCFKICKIKIKHISDFPVSRNTIEDRVMTINSDIQHQLKGDLNNCKYFSICLDETPEVISLVWLAPIAKLSDGEAMREEPEKAHQGMKQPTFVTK